jgi:hypothetical protein
MKTIALIAIALIVAHVAESGDSAADTTSTSSTTAGMTAEPAAAALEHDALGLTGRSLEASSLPQMRLVATASGREVLARVVSCALPAGAAITAIGRDGTPYSFAGALGFAPSWTQHAPTGAERGRVIACIRARNAA